MQPRFVQRAARGRGHGRKAGEKYRAKCDFLEGKRGKRKTGMAKKSFAGRWSGLAKQTSGLRSSFRGGVPMNPHGKTRVHACGLPSSMPSARLHRPIRSLHALVATALTVGSGARLLGATAGPEVDVASASFGLGEMIVGFVFIVGVAALLHGWWSRRGRHEQIVQRSVLSHAAHSIVTTDVCGVIETFNPGAETLLGRRAADLVGRATPCIFHLPAEIEARAAELTRESGRPVAADFEVFALKARESQGAVERDWTWVRADGSPVPVRLGVAAIRNKRGKITGYVVIAHDQTARHEAEESRRALDARLGKIASQVPGMVFQLRQNADGTRCFPYASEGIRDLYGLEPAEVAVDSGKVWMQLHPEDEERVFEAIEISARKLERWQCEYRSRTPDGRVRWLLGTALPEAQADRSIVWHGFITDITERKRAAHAHEEGRELLQSVFSSVDLGVFLVDVTPGGEFRFVEINPAYERLTGIKAEEIRGRRPDELVPIIPEEMAACLRASFRRGVEATGPIEHEEPFFVRGRLLWWLTRLTPLRDEGGRVVRLIGRTLDITERKTVELRFQSLSERLQLATEAAQVGVWDYDVQENRLMWDERQMRIYGLTPKDFDGSFDAWRRRVHPDDVARVDQEFREALERNTPFNTSYRIVRPDGAESELRARAHVQRNPAGRPVRVVGVNWDITAERRAQTAIERARDEAEDLNRQLENALDRAQLLATEAAAATVAKSEFLANMSHEIRTPLNAVIGMSGLLLGTGLTREQREFAETIRSSGDGLLELINDILDYTKIESGRLDLEQRSFDLRDCVESALDVLAARAAEKKIDLLYALEAGVPETIQSDDTRLRQVIVNLLSNAVKFTNVGEVFLSVSVAGTAENGAARLRFSVHDSGIGIPADRMNRLFKTFSQVDASTTRQFGGTGLGLAISKRIVGLMGGRIWVESLEGKGSTFHFEIEAAILPSPNKAFIGAPSSVLSGRRVLIVDDNVTSCRLLCLQAVAWGLSPRAVSSGSEALAVLEQGDPFHLVLADLEMPRMDGLRLAQEIRRVHSKAQLPIALLAFPGNARAPEELGIAGFVNKPVKPSMLFSLFLEIFQGPGTERAPVAAKTGVNLAEGHPLSILLAEDNPVNQRVATLILLKLGYRADVAANGVEALQAVARQRYDLVLMDVQMPEMDGLEASREICKRWSADVRPRIVAMTANASVADRDMCFAAGMTGFLTKPVRTQELCQALLETPVRAVASAA